MSDRPLTAAGAYVYAGGFMVGLRRAGFNVKAHLEGDNAYGVTDASLNWPDLPIHHGPARWPLDAMRGNVDFLVANPPCAIFSAMGIRTTRGGEAWADDPRLAHWWDSFNAFERIEPRAFALESVTQAYSRGRPVIDEMTKRSLVRGYSVTHLLLDAKWCGLPQSRRRFFIVAHKPPALVGYHHNWAPPPTVGETIAEVQAPGHARTVDPRLMASLRATPSGGGLSTAWERLNPGFETRLNAQGKVHGRPSFQDQRLPIERTMGAFVGDKYYHPTEDRMIGVEEMKALCGYPPDFRLAGAPSGWGSMLARAVMPPVGFWLGRAIAATLTQRDAEWGDRRVMLIDVRKPGIEPVDLTDQYLDSNGRVRVRARADGSLVWATSAPSGHASASPGTSDTVRFPEMSMSRRDRTGEVVVLDGVPPPTDRGGPSLGVATDEQPNAAILARGNVSVAPPPEIANGDKSIEPPRWQDRSDGTKARRVPEMQPPSGDRPIGAGRGMPAREAGGGSSAAVDPTTTFVKPDTGEGSGRFIQRLWRETDLSVKSILAAVHANFPGRTTARGDVYYNYRKLVDAGEAVRPWTGSNRGKARDSAASGQSGELGALEETPLAVLQGVVSSGVGPDCRETAADLTHEAVTAGRDRQPSTFRRIAVLDWFPRVCGATDFGAHLVHGDDRFELVTASRSGRSLNRWQTSWDWRVLPLRGIAEKLNAEYDAVVLTDVACLAPEMTERDVVPAYAQELRRLTIPATAVFHGGMTYKPVYDPVIEELVRSPGFTGSIVTVREAQARERLARWPVRYVVHPYLPYREDRADGARAAVRRRAVMMTSRLASNKGQNALLAMLGNLEYDAEVWGYNSFGLPSIGWRLYELGGALGYRSDGAPALRRDATQLTHPNAPRFYTGAFGFTAPNGRRYAYRDGYNRLAEVDWSPWVHVAPFSGDFHGLLEYTILDAIHSGAISMVPEGTVPPDAYDGTMTFFSFDGCTLWSKKDTAVVAGRDFDRGAVAGRINGVLGLTDVELTMRADAQYRAVRARHDPAVMRSYVEAALRGGGNT